MARLIWRGWAALCLLSGAVVVPLFLEVFSGGSWLRFTALVLRYAWLWLLGLPILREGWLPARWAAVTLLGFCALVSGMVMTDLLGYGSVHPGWFLGLEWWQRPIYPWIDLLPRWHFRSRPGYLWIVCVWNVVEAAAVSLVVWKIRGRGREIGEPPAPQAAPTSIPTPRLS